MGSLFGGGSAPKPASVQPAPVVDDTAQKSAAAEAKTREKRRAAAGSMNKTLATKPEGVLGAAPTNTPSLKSSLG